ncbi:MAG: LTA synthase family protein [Clostridia bacterium]|nr:LTA synthase family protein [Clostridia bacterium]
MNAVRIFAHLFLITNLFLTQCCLWGSIAYPLTSIEEIIYYIRMPLQGTAHSFIFSVLHSVIFPFSAFALAIELLSLFPFRDALSLRVADRVQFRLFPLRLPLKLLYPVLVIWLVVVCFFIDRLLWISQYVDGLLHASTLYEEEYVHPDSVKITFPEEKRNLITIYLESMETTAQDVANGGVLPVNAIPELTQIAKDNVSFSRSELIQGASIPPGCGWTVAALVAQTTGVPLRTYNADYAKGNSNDLFSVFMPGAITLGDILKAEGYNTMFMAGSDFTFGGRRVLYETHGDYEIWDYYTAIEEGRIPEDYYDFWGFEDAKLFTYAKDEILELAAKDEPFHFAMLTVDTHMPGYRCFDCPRYFRENERSELYYADILHCNSMRVDDLLSWLREQDFYENTTIVITGDHGTMQDYFYDGLIEGVYNRNTGETNRHVYNAFVNAAAEPVKEKNRIFTTLDIFPTTLAAMGVSIEGDRLGLGVNLFSDEPTLAEKMGEDALFAELRKRSILYDEQLLYPQ